MAYRLDRLASIYLFSPLAQHAAGIPILMYHSIAEENESGVHPYYRVAVSPATFTSQMKYLHDNGYSSLDLSDVTSKASSGNCYKEKQVVITFDDGYQNVYSEAFPILQRFGFKATVFLSTAYIGNSALSFKHRDCLTWPQVRELHRHGITIGSHTVTHPQLHNLCKTLIRHELVDSRNAIEDYISAPVDTFAYPYAFPQADKSFQAVLHNLLRDAGYTSGVCTMVGRANPRSEPLFLPRLPINSADDMDLFRAKLRGSYDWMGRSQSMLKKLYSYML